MKSVFAALITASLASAAIACPPPLPPPEQQVGESDSDYQARLARLQAEEAARMVASRAEQQKQWWDASERVVLARIDRLTPYSFETGTPANHVRLVPVRTLKGSASRAALTLDYDGDSDCGPYGGGSAMSGKVGALYVVYIGKLRGDGKRDRTSYALAELTDARAIARLPASARRLVRH